MQELLRPQLPVSTRVSGAPRGPSHRTTPLVQAHGPQGMTPCTGNPEPHCSQAHRCRNRWARGESDLEWVRFPDDVPRARHQRHPPKLVALDPNHPKIYSEPPAPTCKDPNGPQAPGAASCEKLQLCRSPLSSPPHQGDRRPKCTLTHTRGWPTGWASTRKKSGQGCGDLGKSAVVPKGTRK